MLAHCPTGRNSPYFPIVWEKINMDDWENLRFLAILAREGSFSAAARKLGVEHATVSRRLAALETECGLRLLDRRGKSVLLTADGERLAEVAGRMEREALAAERLMSAGRAGLHGSVTISAPPALAAARLAAPLVHLQRDHPALTIHLVGEVRQASLDRREADIAVRLSRPQSGDLTIVRLGQIAFHFYATPDYLATVAPTAWRFIAYGDGMMAASPQSRRLRELAAGRPVGMVASSSELQLAAAVAGGGVALLPDFMVAAHSGLVIAATGETPLVRDVWLAVHADLRTAPAVRAVVETLKGARI